MSPKLISFLTSFALVLFLVLTNYSCAMANGLGPLSVQTLACGAVVIVGLGGVILANVGKKDDPDIISKVKDAFEDLRGDGR